MVKVRALINYNDYQRNEYITKGKEYDVTQERAEVLLKGNPSSNNQPFVEVVEEKPIIELETAEQQIDHVETADIKPRRKKSVK